MQFSEGTGEQNEKYPRCFDCSRSNSHFGRDLGLFHEVEALPELRKSLGRKESAAGVYRKPNPRCLAERIA
jgi:hypothetical protein